MVQFQSLDPQSAGAYLHYISTVTQPLDRSLHMGLHIAGVMHFLHTLKVTVTTPQTHALFI